VTPTSVGAVKGQSHLQNMISDMLRSTGVTPLPQLHSSKIPL